MQYDGVLFVEFSVFSQYQVPNPWMILEKFRSRVYLII